MSTFIFEKATRQKLRFETNIGTLTVEDLWDLPLTTTKKNNTSLDEVARDIHKKREDIPSVSFVTTVKSPETATLDLKLEIVKYIIAVKLEENSKAAIDKKNKDRKAALLEALDKRKNQQLDNMSEEEILKELNSL